MMRSAIGYRSQVSRALDEEHGANLDLLRRVEQVLVRGRRVGDAVAPEVRNLAGTLIRHLEQELPRHFGFEERELFPRLTDAGDGDMAALLLEEHDAIRAVAGELLSLTRAAAAGTLGETGWMALQRGMLELIERLAAHIQKETMGLLPLVDDLLDEDTDRDLALAYASA